MTASERFLRVHRIRSSTYLLAELRAAPFMVLLHRALQGVRLVQHPHPGHLMEFSPLVLACYQRMQLTPRTGFSSLEYLPHHHQPTRSGLNENKFWCFYSWLMFRAVQNFQKPLSFPQFWLFFILFGFLFESHRVLM